jgi:RNA polymerase sigma-70 factor (ECF subfamily)
LLRATGSESPAEVDFRLVGRLAAGDVDAAAELYDRHGARVFALARRILRNDGDAEDVVQEVFSQVWRSASRYDTTRGTVAGWLLVMARTRAIDRLRARRITPEARADAPLDSIPGNTVAPSDQVVSDEQAALVRRALEALPGEQRLALELAYFEGLTQSEIADRLATPLGTVKTRIRTALITLRGSLRR